MAPGSRFYRACAVRFMLQQHLIQHADLGLGIRASGRLPPDVFRAPLDRIEAALPEELRKAAILAQARPPRAPAA